MSRKTIARAPALRAVASQLLALPLVLGVAQIVPLMAAGPLTIAGAALLQGAIAATLSRLCGLALWWLLIQAAFPIALVATLSLQLPPYIFLVAFLALLGLYWSTFRTQVPFYPSGPVAWKAVGELLPADRPIRFIDVGSGLGGLSLYLSGMRRDSEFTGIEIAPLPWLVSVLRGKLGRARVRFVRGDYERLDFASFDVVFAYLSPAAMPALWHKARSEMRAGTLMLSYEFAIPGAAPHLQIAPAQDGPLLYGWYM